MFALLPVGWCKRQTQRCIVHKWNPLSSYDFNSRLPFSLNGSKGRKPLKKVACATIVGVNNISPVNVSSCLSQGNASSHVLVKSRHYKTFLLNVPTLRAASPALTNKCCFIWKHLGSTWQISLWFTLVLMSEPSAVQAACWLERCCWRRMCLRLRLNTMEVIFTFADWLLPPKNANLGPRQSLY